MHPPDQPADKYHRAQSTARLACDHPNLVGGSVEYRSRATGDFSTHMTRRYDQILRYGRQKLITP